MNVTGSVLTIVFAVLYLSYVYLEFTVPLFMFNKLPMIENKMALTQLY